MMFESLGINAGVYRHFNTGIILKEEIVHYTDYRYIEEDMKYIIYRYNRFRDKEHPLKRICNLKCDFIVTHPFEDGNGRTSRLILNYLLILNGYPPLIIKLEEKEEYIVTLDVFRRTGDSTLFLNFVTGKLLKTYKTLVTENMLIL